MNDKMKETELKITQEKKENYLVLGSEPERRVWRKRFHHLFQLERPQKPQNRKLLSQKFPNLLGGTLKSQNSSFFFL